MNVPQGIRNTVVGLLQDVALWLWIHKVTLQPGQIEAANWLLSRSATYQRLAQ